MLHTRPYTDITRLGEIRKFFGGGPFLAVRAWKRCHVRSNCSVKLLLSMTYRDYFEQPMTQDSMAIHACAAASPGTMECAVAIADRAERQCAPLSMVMASSGFVGEALNATLHRSLAHVTS